MYQRYQQQFFFPILYFSCPVSCGKQLDTIFISVLASSMNTWFLQSLDSEKKCNLLLQKKLATNYHPEKERA